MNAVVTDAMNKNDDLTIPRRAYIAGDIQASCAGIDYRAATDISVNRGKNELMPDLLRDVYVPPLRVST
jgi:hypothetical protein